jgi:hypothetical protein
MATKEVARSTVRAHGAPTFIEYSRYEGKTWAKVHDAHSRELLALAQGSKSYVRRAAELFASTWSAERAKDQRAIDRHLAQAERIKARAIAKASKAVHQMAGAV